MINWIIFDAMGVIFVEGDDVTRHLVTFIQERNIINSTINSTMPIPREKIYEVYRRASIGEINSREFWEDVGLGNEYPDIDKMYLDSRSDFDKDFVPIVRSLSRKYGIGLLSNDIGEWSAYLRKKFSIDFFDVTIVSGDVRCRKPDIKIFERFLKDSGASADECIFIDDRNSNLVVAHSMGMKTVHFVRKDIKHDYIDLKSDFLPNERIGSFGELEGAIERIRVCC